MVNMVKSLQPGVLLVLQQVLTWSVCYFERISFFMKWFNEFWTLQSQHSALRQKLNNEHDDESQCSDQLLTCALHTVHVCCLKCYACCPVKLIHEFNCLLCLSIINLFLDEERIRKFSPWDTWMGIDTWESAWSQCIYLVIHLSIASYRLKSLYSFRPCLPWWQF